MAQKLLTIKQAAEELGVSTKTIRRWEQQGKIEAIRTSGGHRRFKLQEVAPEKAVTFKKLIPYLIPTIIISSITTYTLTKNHFQSTITNLQNQINQLINQTNDPIQSNQKSGIASLRPEDNGQVFIPNTLIKDDTAIQITSQDPNITLTVTQNLTDIGFVVTTSSPITSPIYFNWIISN